MANIQSIITYNANLSPAQAQIKALTGQIGALSTAFNVLDKSALRAQSSLASTFLTNVGQIGGLSTEVIKVNSSVETFGKNIAAQRLTMRQYFREAIAGYTKQNSLVRQLAEQQVRYQQSVAVPMGGVGPGGGKAAIITPTHLNALGNSAAVASQKFSIFNELIQGGSTRLLNFGKNTQWTGRQLMVGLTLPITVFAAVVSKEFRNLDKELTRFEKVYGEDLGNSVASTTEKMRDAVQSLAIDMAKSYGIATSETAALAADIAATGAEGEKLMASVQQTTRLSVLGEVDRQEAMKATLALQTGFKMNTDELAESINFLNAVENQTSTTLQDFATAIPKVGPIIKSLGGDIEDLSLMLVAMREGGIPAAEAANAIKSGLASMINPTKKASDVAKEFGINLQGIVDANRGQLMPTIFAMQEALGQLDDFSRARIIEEIFGKFQFARMSALFANIGKMGSQTNSVLELSAKSATQLASIANTELKVLQESTSMKFQRTLEGLRASLIPLGEVITETLIPIFEFMGSGISTLTKFFSSLPEPIKNFSKYVLVLAAAAGPIIMLVGLFGNLIANGIKVGMMFVRLGAKIAGLQVDKFKLLNADVMGAKLGVDTLTSSFTVQENALNKLVRAMAIYGGSIRTLQSTNPALFVPVAGRTPIRRAAGSTSPEFVPGTGRGDKIPAMLEPGEFVVNKAATEKYAPVLLAMNRGNLPGFQQGTTAAAHTSMPFATNTKQFSLALSWMASSARYGKDFIDFAMKFPEAIKVVSKSVAILPSQLNQALKTGIQSKEFISGWNQTGSAKFAPSAIQGGFDMAQKGAAEALKNFSDRVRDEAVRIAKNTNNGKVNDKILADAQRKVISEIQETASSQDPVQLASKNLARAIENQSLRVGAVRILATQDMIRSGGSKFSTDASGNVMYGSLPVRREGDRDVRYSVPRFISGGMERDVASGGITSAADKLAEAGVTKSSAFGRFTGSTGALVGMPARGAGGGGYLSSGSAIRLIEKEINITTSKLMEKLLLSLVAAVKTTLESGSPSKRAERELNQEGKNLADGAMIGLKNGFKSAVSGKQIIAGPVGGTGLESISNAQKIAQADQAIIRMKTLQQKYISDRVRVEVELKALDSRILQIKKNESMSSQEKLRAILALNQERIALEKIHKVSLTNETRIQDIINGYKQRIASANESQLRSEEQEAAAAAKRVAYVAQFQDKMALIAAQAGPSLPIGQMGGPMPIGQRFAGMTPEDRKNLAAARRVAAGYSADTPGDVRRAAASTGPAASLNEAKGMGDASGKLMNAAFMGSMLISSISMMGGASAEASAKLGIFTTALMTATMAASMFSGKNVAGNFLGLNSLGGKMAGTAAAGRAAQMGGVAAAAKGGQMGGAALLGAGRLLSVAGGPVGIAAGIGITAAIAGFMAYRNAAEEATKRAKGAFEEPVKAAEFFGIQVKDVGKMIEEANFASIDEDLTGVDESLREAIQEDYGALIEKIRYLNETAGAQELSMAFSNMILSGMNAEQARESIKAISIEAGEAGGLAFAEASSKGMLKEMTPEEAMKRVSSQFDPSVNKDLIDEQRLLVEGQTALVDELQRKLNLIYSMPGVDLSALVESGQLDPGDTADSVSRSLNETLNLLDQTKTKLAELENINPDAFVPVAESLLMGYGEDPDKAIKAMDDMIDRVKQLEETGDLSSGDKRTIMNDIAEFMEENNPAQWAQLSGSIDTLDERMAAMSMTVAGIPLTDALNEAGEFDLALARAAIGNKVNFDELILTVQRLKDEFTEGLTTNLNQELQDIDSTIVDIDDKVRTVQINLRRGLEQLEKNFEATQKSSEIAIEGMEDEIESIEEKIDKKKEESEETIKGLEEEKEGIEKSSDAYIKSLQKRSKADSFYANQRKTSFSALQKLAAGDVFGFLQDREELGAAAQQFSYDKEISGIEERRDAETDAIDELIEKEQERQEKFEKINREKIDLIRKEIETERDLMEQREESYQAQVKSFTKIKNERLRDLKNAKEKEGQKRADVQEIIDTANQGEIVSAQKLQETLGPILAAPYIEKQKQILKAIYMANLEREKASGTLTPEEAARSAASSLIGLYMRLFGTPDQGAPNAQDLATILEGIRVPEQNRAQGGYIRGKGTATSDSIPARLSDGEYVVRASSVSKYGVDLMDAINEENFAVGGYVSADRAAHAAEQRRVSNNTANQVGGYAGQALRQPYRGTSSPTAPIKRNTLSYSPSKNSQAEKRIQKEFISTPDFKSPGFFEEFYGLWQGVRSGAATVIDSFNQFSFPWSRGRDTTTPFGRFIGGDQYTQSPQTERALMAMGLLPFGRGASGAPMSRSPIPPTRYTPSGQGMLPFLDSTGSSYKPLLSIDRVQLGPAPGTAISIGVDSNAAAGILSSGRFKNIYQGTNARHKGHTDSSLDMRMGAEEAGWGLSANTPGDQRPVYGFLRDKSLIPDEKFDYGNIIFDIKHDPMKKTTYYPGDSLVDFGAGFISPWERLKTSHSPLKAPFYGEVQMPPPTIRDVAGANIIIPRNASVVEINKIKEIVSQLSRNNIPVKVRYPENFGQRGFPGSESWDLLGPQNFLAAGGFVRGPGTPTSDSIPARLSDGEYVVKASSVKKYGKGMMEAINEQKFAEGGLVQAPERGLRGVLSLLEKKDPPRRDGEGRNSGAGNATGTPIFNENILSNLGYSLDTAKNVVNFLDSGGWPKELHRLGWSIAMRESGGNPRLYHDHITDPSLYSKGNGDYGLFQLNKKSYGSQPWFDTQKLLDGSYNSSAAYKYVANNGSSFLPWGMKKTYNGTNEGFDWSSYPGGSSWRFASTTMKRTNALWPAFQGYRGGTVPSSGNSGSQGGDGSLAVNFAKKQLGEPYVIGGRGPDSWDCSGLTAAAWNQGVPNGYQKYNLIPYSTSQANVLKVNSRRVSGSPGDGSAPTIPDKFNIGDILYFTNTGLGLSGKHVSMYAGSGQIVEAGSPVQMNPLNNTWNKKYFSFGGTPTARFAAGGFVSGKGGPRSDSIPARLSNGEYVVKAASVAKYGKGFMDQVNAGRFNAGGMVGSVPSPAAYSSGGMSMATPTYGMPSAPDSSININSGITAGSTNNNSSKVNIIINGGNNTNATAIANKVVSMINSSNNRRIHSRSA